jgi:hypothetical protein
VAKFQATAQLLQSARKGYGGRIHFVDLRDKGRNQKAVVAASWLNVFFTDIVNYCAYKCMVVDMGSPAFEKSRLLTPNLLYNNTALLAVYSGVTWSLSKYDEVTLSIYSERLTRAKDDNFEDYLPQELVRRSKTNKACCDVLIPSAKVTLVNGDPRKVDPSLTDHCEFIQLTDVITGAIGEAINAKATNEVKLNLGDEIASWIGDTRLPPWLQQKQLHRRFSVSCYPNHKGEFYDVQLARSLPDQPKFDGF